MVIMSNSQLNILNLEQIENIFIGADRKSIKANMVSRAGCEVAKYENFEQCKYALEMLFVRIKSEDKTFQFPSIQEIEERRTAARSASIHVKTKQNRRGGS